MKYLEIQDKIKTGDLLLWSEYDWSTWHDIEVQIVRMATRSEYSHAALAVVEDCGNVSVIESVVPYVRKEPLSNLVGTHGFYWVPLNRYVSQEEIDFALSLVGTGEYSKLQAMQAQIATIDIGEDALWSCAEFFMACARKSGIDYGPKATPAALAEKVMQLGFQIYRILP